MRGARVSSPVGRLALIGGAGAAMLLAAPALAADPVSTAVGPPTPLFSPSPQAASPSPAAQPMHNAAIASPGRHPAAPVQRIPLDTKPLIPPAAPVAKLGPSPDARPALSLETDLEPLTPAGGTPAQSGAAGAAAPPAVKPPSS